MSQKYRTGFTDPQYGVDFDQLGNRSRCVGPVNPASSFNAALGFLPGCIFQNTTSPTVLGAILFVNTGTVTSATWTNIL